MGRSQHKETTRKCPGCGKVRTFPERNETCKRACANEMKRKASQSKALPVAEEHAIKRENSRLRAELKEALEKNDTLSRFHRFIEGIPQQPRNEIPEWVANPKHGARQATPTAFLSDTHFDENVLPEQIEWLNAYNRPLGGSRLKKFFLSSAELAHGYLKGLSYPGIILPLGGDIFSGDIHEELAKTNEAEIQQSLLYWIDPMIAGIKFFADEFGKVHIPVVVGNHPRGTKKPSHKMRVPNNFDWLFAQLLAKFMKDDKRVTFQISDSADCNYSIYSTRYRLSHGDQFKGGSGIAGALSPLMIGDARKRKRANSTHKGSYDWLLLGHWHQRFIFKNIMVNGSLKGYDEYAYHNNFEFVVPFQSFWITDPRYGVTITAPIFVQGKDEPWMRQTATTQAFAKAA